jgi:hypothetical protein
VFLLLNVQYLVHRTNSQQSCGIVKEEGRLTQESGASEGLKSLSILNFLHCLLCNSEVSIGVKPRIWFSALQRYWCNCSSRHQIACFKATEGIHNHAQHNTPHHAGPSRQYKVANSATPRLLSCLHSPGLGCSCYNVVRYFSDREAWNLLTATTLTCSQSVIEKSWMLSEAESNLQKVEWAKSGTFRK